MGGSIFDLGANIDPWMGSICLAIVIAITIAFEGSLHHIEAWIKDKASDITREVYMEMIQKLYKVGIYVSLLVSPPHPPYIFSRCVCAHVCFSILPSF